MSNKRYTEEFKREPVCQVTERGYSVADVAARLDTTTHSLYAWSKRYGAGAGQQSALTEAEREPSAEGGAEAGDRGA